MRFFERPKTIGPSPEELEPQRREQMVRRFDALLNPNIDNSFFLYSRIEENVYGGAVDKKAIEESVKKRGYDPNVLKQVCEKIQREYEELIRKLIRKDPRFSSQDYERMGCLEGFLFKKSPSRRRIPRRDDLSIGLAYETVRQGKKFIKATLEKDQNNQRGILSQDEVDVSRDEIRRFIEILEKKDPELKAKSVLDHIENPNKKKTIHNCS